MRGAGQGKDLRAAEYMDVREGADERRPITKKLTASPPTPNDCGGKCDARHLFQGNP